MSLHGPLAPKRAANNRSRYVPPSRKKLWVPALTIIGSLLAGLLFAVGHHLYYSALDGKAVDTTTALAGLKVYDQKWSSHVGTALAFLTKFFFSLCIGAAYVETLWKTARRPLGLSIAGLDASFGLLNNPMNFLSTDLLFSAQFLIILAAISWLIPLVSVFTPGALTVASVFVNGTIPCAIPALNLASVNAAVNLGSYNTDHDDSAGGLSSPSQALQRIATTALLDGTYSAPISPCAPGASVCTYSTSYVAPYFKCSDPVYGAYLSNPSFKPTGGVTLFNATYLPSTSAGDQMLVAWSLDNSDPAFDGAPGGYTVTCSTMNATYSVDVQHTSGTASGTHTVDVSSIVLNGVLNSDPSTLRFQTSPLSNSENPDITRSQVLSGAVMLALEAMLVGTIERSDSSQKDLGIFMTVNKTMAAMSNLGRVDESARNFTAAPDMPGLITSLLQNVTIGLMSNNISDSATSATCVQSGTQNIYVYHPTTLWPPYAAAVVCAGFAALIGLSAVWSNQTKTDTSFTTMIQVTRNSALDAVPEEDPSRVRLRYGLITDGGEQRMAFGQLWNFGDHPLALPRKEA
ncbi:Catalase domain-containing protein [Mycena venus]|uniref:Catalase domain-containing protein n=1 Tax=Mycena venus TaxID=2733690 RepID=A0A8H6YCK8_9AGAR|nr:Catalase domain-containing protein [Mycena venus]